MRAKNEFRTDRARKKKEYGALFGAITEILFRHDPAAINFGFNRDEYEPEAETILPRLKNCRSADDVLSVVREEFQRWFDAETATCEKNKEIAEAIWNLWQNGELVKVFMAEEFWLSGTLEGFSPVMMPAAHALRQAIADLEKAAADLSGENLIAQPNGAPSVAFHLRHIAGSIDRLLTYARGGELSDEQLEFLRLETAETSDLSAEELVAQAVKAIESALRFCKLISPETLFEARFVGRRKLATNVFGLLFHIAEHTARHVGQVVTTARIVRR